MLNDFPAQKLPTSKKGDDFYIKCMDAIVNMVNYEDDSGLRASMREKQLNNDLANNILDQNDVESVVNPWRIEGYDFPLEMRNYPLLKSKIDLLVGEELKRRFSWKVVLRNPEAIAEKQTMIKDRYFNEFVQLATSSEEVNEAVIKERVQRLDKWKMYEAQDIRERMSSEVLAYQWDNQACKFKFNKGYEEALIMGEEVYSVRFIDGEVVFDKEDPLCVYTLRSNQSPFIEDSDIIFTDKYKSLGAIIDDYHEYLTDKQIDLLESAYTKLTTPSMSTTPNLTVPDNYYSEEYNTDIEILDKHSLGTFNGTFDENGNIREVRACWVSWRVMGVIKTPNDDGSYTYSYCDENYKANKELGEKIKWIWVKEWLQAVRIGDDITINLGPFPRLGASFSNPSKCMCPFVGTAYTIGNNKAMSMMSYGRPYQYMFNATMHRTEKLVINTHGAVNPLPLHLIPDEWNIDDWLYYFSYLNFYVYDGFKEGNKGAATGKLAGNMQVSNPNFNSDNSNAIQQNILLLNLIKSQLDELTGVTPQRLGQIQQRELVGNVEHSITNSSHVTEKWNALHENTKVRALALILEATKYAWRNKGSFQRQCVLSDMSSFILNYDAELMGATEFGIFISDSANDTEMFASLQRLSETALQAKLIKFSDIAAMYMSTSGMQIRRRLEQGEAEAIQMAQQQFQAEQEQLKQELANKQLSEDKANELKRYIAELQEETKRMVANIPDNTESIAERKLDLEQQKIDDSRQQHSDDLADKKEDRNMKERLAKSKPVNAKV